MEKNISSYIRIEDFGRSNIFFFPRKGKLSNQMSSIISSANYAGYKVRIRQGVWLEQKSLEPEKILKVEVLGRLDNVEIRVPKKRGPKPKPKLETRPETKSRRKTVSSLCLEDRNSQIFELKAQGKTLSEIGKIFNIKKQRVSQIIKWVIKKGDKL